MRVLTKSMGYTQQAEKIDPPRPPAASLNARRVTEARGIEGTIAVDAVEGRMPLLLLAGAAGAGEGSCCMRRFVLAAASMSGVAAGLPLSSSASLSDAELLCVV